MRCPSLLEVVDDAFVGRTGTGSIQIHAGYASLWEDSFHVVFNLLRTKATVAQVHSLAGRTLTGHGLRVTAVMAGQLVEPLMVGEADVAVLAFGYPAARVTLDHRCKAAAVLEEDDLFLLLQRLAHVLQ